MNKTARKIWTLFTKEEKQKTLWILALVIFMALAETVGVISIIPFLSVLARPGIIHENLWLSDIFNRFEFSNESNFIIALGISTMAIMITSSAFKTITFHTVGHFIHTQRVSLGLRLLAVYLNQPYIFFLTRNSSELAKNILSEVDQLVFDLLQPISSLIAQGAIVVAMTLLVLIYDPLMAICIIATVGMLYALIYLIVRKRLTQIGIAQQATNTRRHLICHEALQGIKDIKINQATNIYLQRFAHYSREFSHYSATADTLSQSPLYIVEAVGYTGLIIIAIFLLWQSGDIAHVLPALGLYGFAAYRLLPAVQIMYRGITRLRLSSAALQLIHNDLSLKTEKNKSSAINTITIKRRILLDGIFYSYPANPENPILKNITIDIPINTCIGISGKSGAGKSTLMDIFLGLLDPQKGVIYADNTPINSSNINAWRAMIGYVPQHIYLADSTVAENIAFGIPYDEIDINAVEKAARAAQIHDFIVSHLTSGYYTQIGERGIRLSGGQRQRIGIARALYRDPMILCMDEATSALDTTTETCVNEAIQTLSGEKTIIVIAHRPASLKNCDQIFELE